MAGDLYLWMLVVGVWVTFAVFGWATEALTSTKFGEEGDRFKFTWFLVFLQSAGNALVAAVMLFYESRGSKDRLSFSAGTPIRDWAIVAVAYLGAHKFGLLALMYISYPLQVLSKSCKSVPVMFGEVLFGTADLTVGKVVNVFVLTAGVVVFTLGKDSGKKGSDVGSLDQKTMIGLSLAVLALVCDGIYGPYQNKIRAKAKEEGRTVSSYHLMFNLNLYQGLLALGFLLGTSDELSGVMLFVEKHPEVLKPIVNFAAAMALGNIFIFKLQAGYGSLAVTKTTTVRKVITILLSIYWFNHSMNPVQWVGVALVFLSEPIKLLADKLAPKTDKVE